MSTYDMLSNFTHAEISALGLQHKTMSSLSDSELLKLAQMRLERFSPETPEHEKMKKMLDSVLTGIGSSLAYDALKFVWTPVLTQIIDFLTELLAK